MINAVWIEIPVKDIHRALKFYSALFDLPLVEIQDDGTRKTATLTGTQANGPGISLNQTANFEPSNKGIFVYLDTGEDFTPMAGRVEPAGGKIVDAKTYMEGAGYYSSFLDTEGNLLALYSVK
jgi:hypothetical protein